MRLWVGDCQKPPVFGNDDDWYWVGSVNEAKYEIEYFENEEDEPFELIYIDCDVKSNAYGGGDYINLLYWLEETGRSYPIYIHSKNHNRAERMRLIVQNNGWTEIRKK